MAVFYTSQTNNLIQYYFEVGGNELDGSFVINTDITTDFLEMVHGGNFQIQIGLFNSDGRANVTIQQSSDTIMWDDMRNASSVRLRRDDSLTFEDFYFTGRYIRVIVEPVSLNSGEIKMILTEKA